MTYTGLRGHMVWGKAFVAVALGYQEQAKNWLCYAATLGTLVMPLAGCAVTPRVSTWQAPNRFTAKDVFSAALQAGSQQGMQLSASDRESGTMSFRRSVGKGEMIFSVNISAMGDRVQVRTAASYGGGLAIRGLHEEYIRNFHVFLFRNLGVTDPSERSVNIDVMS